MARLYPARFFNLKHTRHLSTIKEFSEIPGPVGLPIIGNTWRYLPFVGQYNQDKILDNGLYNFKRYGPIVREQITNELVVLHLFDPEDIESLFRQESRTRYPQRRSHRALLKYRLDRPDKYNDGGLFPENGSNWAKQRKRFQHLLMFNLNDQVRLRRYVGISESVTKEFISYLNQHKHIETNEVNDLQKYLYEWSMTNSLRLLFNIQNDRFDDKSKSDLIQANHDALEAIAKTETSHNELWKKSPNKCPHYGKLIRSQETLYDYVYSHISKARENQNEIAKDSLLFEFFNLSNADDKDITAMTLDLILAGLHTTSYTVAFVLYHLALNPSIQSRLRADILSHSVTHESFEKLTFLHDCVKESMRLQPLSIGTGRYIDYDGVVIRDYKIKRNTMVITHNQIACLNENTFEEASKYNPDRWQTYRLGPKSNKPNSFALLPFGYGARMCIGRRFAELQIYSLVGNIIKHFMVECHDEMKTKTMLINVPDKPITMKFIDLKR